MRKMTHSYFKIAQQKFMAGGFRLFSRLEKGLIKCKTIAAVCGEPFASLLANSKLIITDYLFLEKEYLPRINYRWLILELDCIFGTRGRRFYWVFGAF